MHLVKRTFSGENGGIIKAYGNVIVGAQKIIYANAVSETGDSANAASFDAYLAKSADEKFHLHIRQQVEHLMITLIQLRISG